MLVLSRKVGESIVIGQDVVITLLDATPPGWLGSISSQPAAVTVPLAFVVMVAVSLLTPTRVPQHVSRTMVRLHTPEAVELDRGPYPL